MAPIGLRDQVNDNANRLAGRFLKISRRKCRLHELISESDFVNKIGFIGAGQMAKALAAGIVTGNHQATFLISDPSDEARNTFSLLVGAERVGLATSNQEVFEQCQIVFLAVKPQYLDVALAALQINPKIRPLIVSVIAGVPIAKIVELTGIDRVIRVMPNTPCLVGQGVCGVAFPEGVGEQDIDQVRSFLDPMGLVMTVSEPLLDSVTGLSGSGPAFVFAFMESLIQGAVETGMSREIATELAIQTVLGAAALVKETGEPISTLRKRVTSPGGTTLAGLNALKQYDFHTAVVAAVKAATDRSRELGGR